MNDIIDMCISPVVLISKDSQISCLLLYRDAFCNFGKMFLTRFFYFHYNIDESAHNAPNI